MNCWPTPDPGTRRFKSRETSLHGAHGTSERSGFVVEILFIRLLQSNRYTPLHEKLQGGVLLPNERLIYA